MRLTIDHIEFSYSSRKILDEVTFELDCSEVLCIVGPNGAGKSTLIKCIDRVINPCNGRILLNDKDLEDMSGAEIARSLGYVPQNSSRNSSVTVFEMVLMGRRPHCGWMPGKNDMKKTADVLKLIGIEHLAMSKFNELSGGQQQKVILARAIAQETSVLLLDEPTSNLDIRHQLGTMEIIKRLVAIKKISAIMAIHDLNLAARYADRILMLKGGTIYGVGHPNSVLTNENIKNVYGIHASIKLEDGRPYIVPKYSAIDDEIGTNNLC
jgi:iron complex transport system ATP-binding protein